MSVSFRSNEDRHDTRTLSAGELVRLLSQVPPETPVALSDPDTDWTMPVWLEWSEDDPGVIVVCSSYTRDLPDDAERQIKPSDL